mmetsp:Transcript_36950/g.93216  ORF Transcript_36950/g.93216 Transcript_36950/m.93216 type:complete len:186 (-) Transcript_36950:333-890(-)
MIPLALPNHHAEPPTYVLDTSPDRPYQADAATVKMILLDTDTSLALHPLLVSIKPLTGVDQVQGGGDVYKTQEYEFLDSMKVMGLCTMHSNYTGRVWYMEGSAGSAAGSSIWWRAKAGMGVGIDHVFDITSHPSNPGHSLVKQTTWVTAPWLVRSYVIGTARRAHAESLEKLHAHVTKVAAQYQS